MVPPPPSQAGRFKPRKPAKKIRVGEAAPPDGAVVAAAGPSASVPSTTGTSRGGRGPGRGGRGGGGGGRGTRAPMTQGQVFFEAAPKTGSMKPSAASSLSSKSKGKALATVGVIGGAGRGLGSRKEQDAQEEIVGMMEEGVGSGVQKTSKKPRTTSALDRLEDKEGATSSLRKPKVSSTVDGLFFDDDSSEDEMAGSVPDRSKRLQPIILPAAETESLRARTVRPEVSSQQVATKKLNEDPVPFLTSMLRTTRVESTAQPSAQPDDWLLVQLPTRLPPLYLAPVLPDPVKSAPDGPSYTTNTTDITPVNLPSVRADRFDHVLPKAVPGRLGRLVVYRSGKVDLLLEGPDGVPTIRMNVTGHNSGFLQQAVCVDPDNGKFIVLGDVQNTIVVTPDLAD